MLLVMDMYIKKCFFKIEFLLMSLIYWFYLKWKVNIMYMLFVFVVNSVN